MMTNMTLLLLLDASMLPAANDNAPAGELAPLFSDSWDEEEPTRHDALAECSMAALLRFGGPLT